MITPIHNPHPTKNDVQYWNSIHGCGRPAWATTLPLPLFVMLMSTNSYVGSWKSLGDHYIYIIGANIDVRSWGEFGDCHVRLKEIT